MLIFAFQIQGTTRNHRVTLKYQIRVPDSFMDEATAILFTSQSQKLSLEQFTSQYNKAFPSAYGELSSAKILDILKTLPNVEVST